MVKGARGCDTVDETGSTSGEGRTGSWWKKVEGTVLGGKGFEEKTEGEEPRETGEDLGRSKMSNGTYNPVYNRI